MAGKLHVPVKVPAKIFWSVTVYNLGDRSMIANDQKKPALDSSQKLQFNPDGSVDLYFGPKAPAGGALVIELVGELLVGDPKIG